MAVWTRRLFPGLLAGIVGLAVGCDAATLAYFFMPDAREPAKIKNLSSDDPKKPAPRVAILTWKGSEMRSEFIHADRQISDMLGAKLRELAASHKEKLDIIPARKIDEYKNKHPNWASNVAEVGRNLEADYVIYLEINSMSLYEPGMDHQLFRGRAELTINLIDVQNPDETAEPKPFSCVYPGDARGPVQAGFDKNAAEFRMEFLASVATKVSYYFSCYPKRNCYMPD